LSPWPKSWLVLAPTAQVRRDLEARAAGAEARAEELEGHLPEARASAERAAEAAQQEAASSSDLLAEMRRVNLELKRVKRAQNTQQTAASRESSKARRLLELELKHNAEMQAKHRLEVVEVVDEEIIKQNVRARRMVGVALLE